MQTFAQTNSVSGKVVSGTDSQPIPGVVVMIKGTNGGASTTADGSFTVSIPGQTATLQFRYVGYTTKEVDVKAGQNITVTLTEDVTQLNDVVVVGYSSKKQSELTSSVTVVSANKLKDVTTNNVGSMLQGKVAGLQVVNSSGQPGSAPEIRLRGVSSVNASQSPLFVVDGIIGGNYDPNDVESITVLKDAGATALYGSQANAGVIIVTTKTAKEGRTRFNAKITTGFRTADFGKLDPMNSSQLYDYQKELYRDYIVGATDNTYKIDLGKFYAERPLRLRGQDYDWVGESFKRAPLTNVYISATGKTEKNSYYVGASYFDEKGTFTNTNYKRLNLRANSTYTFTKDLSITNNINLSASKGNSYDYMDMYYSFLNIPWDNPYNADGSPFYMEPGLPVEWWSRDRINPLHTIENSDHPYKGLNVNYDLVVNYNITPWLTFTSSNRVAAGTDKSVNYFSPLVAGNYKANGGYIYELSSLNYGFISNNLLKFNFQLGDHNLSGFAGLAFENGRTEYSGGSGQGLPVGLKQLSVATSQLRPIGYFNQNYLNSFLSQVNYNFKNKYFLSGSFRVDGSSAFPTNNQYASFPSISGAWLVSNEEFLANNSSITNLKLRASYGITGTQDIGSSRFLGLYALTTQYDGKSAAVPYQLESPNLTWESKRQVNVGFDLSLFNRVTLTVDAYHNNTKDLLLQVAQPLSVGFETRWANVGNVINKGIEIGINASPFKTGKFEWNTDFNVNFNSNKLENLPATNVRSVNSVSQIYRNGGNLYEFYLPKWAGVDAATGSPLWEKLVYNEAGESVAVEKTSNYSEATYQEAGSALPKYQGGFNNTFTYKDFSLRVNTYFSYGAKIFSNNLRYMRNDGNEPYYNQIVLPEGSKIWSGPGDTEATEPSPQNSAGSTETSTRYLKDASYFTIRNISFNYNLPASFAKKLNFEGISVGVSADNVATFTNFLGQDPQTTITGGNFAMPGLQDFKYPNNRQYLLNINFNF
ncbi:SusC/RagA family TonB-linked outer membrane protein [Mucilaginibacter limnophilus]|uniref:SusC/RagA family TonB-linked outer membrane protein n=1 Tax=Mucilaginibacter limnophilus TaxID=1932778 RepID=A0A437MFP4_9SPHI|nr:SusC/RagA family TonB-linked outer membrane protein [Mucilaginibacter limnophilus]